MHKRKNHNQSPSLVFIYSVGKTRGKIHTTQRGHDQSHATTTTSLPPTTTIPPAMDFDLHITPAQKEHWESFHPHIESIRIHAYRKGAPPPPSSPFKTSKEFQTFVTKELCKCHDLYSIWNNLLAEPLSKGDMTYQQLVQLIVGCYDHDNPTHRCPNINKSLPLISHSLLLMKNPIFHQTRDTPYGFTPPFIYTYFMQPYMHFWDKIVTRILIQKNSSMMKWEGLLNPFDEGNRKKIEMESFGIGDKWEVEMESFGVRNKWEMEMEMIKVREKPWCRGMDYYCYKKKTEVWSSYM